MTCKLIIAVAVYSVHLIPRVIGAIDKPQNRPELMVYAMSL